MRSIGKPTAEKRVVIINVFGHSNAGDAMLLETLIAQIRSANPETTIEGLAFQVESEREWMPALSWHERIGNSLGQGKARRLLQLAWCLAAYVASSSRAFWFLRKLLPKDQQTALEALDGAPLVISCPGGYLEDSNSAYVLNLLQISLATRLAKAVVLAPQSIGPIRRNWSRRLAASVLGNVDVIFARESWSMDFMKTLMPSIREQGKPALRSSGDLAFWFPVKTERVPGIFTDAGWQVQPDRLVGMTLVDWNFPTAQNPAAAREAYLNALCQLLDHLRAKGYDVIIFNQVRTDLSLSKRLKKLRDWVIVDEVEHSSKALASMISHCRIFVGTRFHSCIFAMLGSVPTCAIAYLPKTEGIMLDLQQERYVLPITSVTGPDLIRLSDELDAKRDEVSLDLKRALAEYRKERGAFLEYLTTVLGEKE